MSSWRTLDALRVAACLACYVPMPTARAHAQRVSDVRGLAPSADTSPFRPLPLPPPNEFRDSLGRPGPRYWQQRVDYSIDAALDTSTHTLIGRELVRYSNNSPDTLRLLWFQLDQNLYRHDSRGATLFPELAKGGGSDFHGGEVVDSVIQLTPRVAALDTMIRGTLMRVGLAHPLAHGDTATLRIVYHFQIPEHGSNRMGRTRYAGGWMYGVAQWYPRAAVYDDVTGWNLDEYAGQGEFYLEYGDIRFAVTVPRSFVVAGSGTLLNPDDVLTSVQRERLARARTSETTILIIAPREAAALASRPNGQGMLTWRFAATNVRDASWAASPAFVWDASGWRGILMQSFYEPPPNADPDWAHSTEYVRNTVTLYSEKWMQYPYPTATNIAGPNTTSGGMEYPMIAFEPSGYGGRALRSVTLHEFGHQWFPMIVGSNERRYAWMDEGIDTFINDAFDWSDRGGFPPTRNGDGWARAIAAGHDGIPMTPADTLPSTIESFVSYSKPSMALYLLRYQIADSTRFDAALREYVRRWAFKHPTPADFFRTMETQLGMDLSWFWRGWFYSTAQIDLAVDSVTMSRDAASRRLTAHIFLANYGTLPMPVPIRLTAIDGRTRELRLPVDIWRNATRHRVDLTVDADVSRVEIDADRNLPDVRRQNNVWTKPQR